MGWSTWPYMFLLLFIPSSVSSSSASLSSPSPLCHIDESNALLQFKNSFFFDYFYVGYCDRYYNVRWPKTMSWKRGTDCCGWSGVTCDNITGHVIGLDLRCGMLQGSIHSNSSLILLRHLQTLILSFNDFRGSTIPPEFGMFADLLHLDIWSANFSGDIPLEVSYLSKLQSLYISVFDGDQQLRLSTSSFERIVTNLTNLQIIALDSVDMSHVDPTSLMNLSSSLTYLLLENCGLRGNSPTTIFQLPKLKFLSLHGNYNLSGFLPKYNWSSSLIYLSLSETNFTINIPDLARSLKSLEELYLSNCKFIGSFPILFGNLTQFTSLDLSWNNIIGQIPWSSFNLKRLRYLNLRHNNFIGQLPASWSCNSTRVSSSPGHVPLYLEVLDLSYNLLNGTIPNWLLTLPSLHSLYLCSNKFTGHISEFQTPSLTDISLSNNKLNGSIPISIFQQVNLAYLDLSHNSLSGFGSIDHSPNTLSFSSIYSNHSASKSILPNLGYLGLSHNQIRGNVPKWLHNVGRDSLYYLNLSHNFVTYIDQISWKNLEILDVRSNLLQGHLPIPLASTIQVFLASHNQLTGEIRSLICKLRSLVVLDLANNSLSGKLPPCIGNLGGSLSVLDLRMNKFLGTIPVTMFGKKNILRNLNLNGNQLEGSLPRSLLNCQKLEVLDIGNNNINGAFPHWLDSLPMLQVLILRSNKFDGSIANPMVGFPFRKLRILDLSNNEFSGKLPAKYFGSLMAMMEAATSELKYMGEGYYEDSVSVEMKGNFIELEKILNIFTTIDFSKNNFEGEIPKLIGNLKSLKGLNFSHNQLTGPIPPSFGNLSSLEWLDLSSNQLVGGIPCELTYITSLAVLNLSENRLVGPIPSGKQFDTFGNTSYSENLGLCGPPLTKKCSNNEPEQEGESDQDEQTNGFELWKIVVIGYGCGIVVGISIRYMMLSDKRIALFMRKLGREAWFPRIKC